LTADGDGTADPRTTSKAAGGRRGRTRFVVLGMLALGPASAYALRQRIASSVGYFWQESFGQLFPTLAELEKKGMVSGRSVAEGKRRRRDYQLTPDGQSALAAWLNEPPAPQPERNELLLKVFFASPGDVAALGSFIAHADAAARAEVVVLRGIEASLHDDFATDPRLPFWRLTVRYGILGNEALMQWCKEARRAVEASI
jgi:PadR family transcriptional regulator, regulatory protein AphA